MENLNFNNTTINETSINEIVTNGYTVKVGTVSGNSIEVLQICQSIVYYDRVSDRDADFKKLKKAIADAKG